MDNHTQGDESESAVDELHHAFRVALAGGNTFGSDLFNAFEVGGRQLHVERAKIFLQIFSALGAGNRKDVVALSKKTREGQLAWRAAFFARQELDAREEIEIFLEVLPLEAR